MIEALIIGLAGLASLLACYAAFYVGAAAISPRFFLDELSFNDARFKKLSDRPSSDPTYRWTYYVGSAALLSGLFVLMFHAANALTMWVPSSWIEAGGEDDVRWTSVQLTIGLFFFALSAHVVTKLEANAHRLVKPIRWKLSSWATRGYDRAEELITDSKGARRSEIDLKPGYAAMEFFKGFDIRLAEEGDRDAREGRYRPTAFENRESYIEAWRQSVSRLRISGWTHPQVELAFEETEKSRKAEAIARDKAYWKSALGFDPDEVLGV